MHNRKSPTSLQISKLYIHNQFNAHFGLLPTDNAQRQVILNQKSMCLLHKYNQFKSQGWLYWF